MRTHVGLVNSQATQPNVTESFREGACPKAIRQRVRKKIPNTPPKPPHARASTH